MMQMKRPIPALIACRRSMGTALNSKKRRPVMVMKKYKTPCA